VTRPLFTVQALKKITLIITHRCNQRCEFCFDASNVLAADGRADMSMETLARVLRLLRSSTDDPATFNVTLSGGEPTLHPRFLDVVRAVSSAGFPITILTNGHRLADTSFFEEVGHFNLWNLQFSIEGATAESHDERVGCAGAFDCAIRAIRNAQQRGIRYITNTTMTVDRVREMFDVIDFLDALGVPKMNIGNTLPECAGRNYGAMLQYPQVVEIAEQLTLYAMTKRVNFSFITPLPLCLKQGRVVSNPSVCSAGRVSTVVDPDGILRPCSVCTSIATRPIRVEDVASLDDAYSRMDEAVAVSVVDGVPAECATCPRRAECRAACPLYWKARGVLTPSQWQPGRSFRPAET